MLGTGNPGTGSHGYCRMEGIGDLSHQFICYWMGIRMSTQEEAEPMEVQNEVSVVSLFVVFILSILNVRVICCM